MPTIASLNVNLTASIASFNKAMQSAANTVTAVGKQMTSLGTSAALYGGALTTAFGAAAKVFASTGDALDEMSIQTGIATESLSALAYAGSFSSVSMEDIGKSINKMQKELINTPKAFTKLGINLAEFKKLKPEEQMAQIADAINRLPTAAEKTAAAMEIFGRNGAALLPFFSQGSEGINALTEEARRMGLVIGGDTARSAAALDDAMTKVSSAVKGLAFNIGAALAPAITFAINKVMEFTGPIIAWIRENQTLVASVAAIGAAVFAFGSVLATVGAILTFAAPAVAAIGAAFAFMLSPIGLAIAAIAAIGAAVIYLAGGFINFANLVQDAILAIVFTVQNWQLSWEIAAASIALSLVQIGAEIQHWFTEALPAYFNWFMENWQNLFVDMGNIAVTTVTNMATNLMNIFTELWDFISSAGADSLEFTWTPLLEGFEATTQALPEIAERVVGPLEQSLKNDLDKLTDEWSQGFEKFAAENRIKIGMDTQEVADAAKQTLEDETIAVEKATRKAPELITAGSKEAFNLGRNRPDENAGKTAENTGKTASGIATLNKKLDKGIKTDIQVIEAFA